MIIFVHIKQIIYTIIYTMTHFSQFNTLLVIILTSNNIKYLDRAIESIDNQHPSKFDVTVKILVNSNDSGYMDQVLKKFSCDYDILQTNCTGNPGKGHNDCLRFFKMNSEYKYLTILDGDDVFYPIAFQRLYHFIDKFCNNNNKFDILYLMTNDRVSCDKPKNQTIYNLKHNNFNLNSSFDTNIHFWKDELMPLNPFKNPIYETKTPARPILFNRNIFKSAIPILYGEKMKLYDDMILFCNIYEAYVLKQIKVLITSESYIYLFNAFNHDSLNRQLINSNTFKKHEEINFRYETEHLEYVQQWNLNKFPFGHIDPPKNYNTYAKHIFCHNNIVSPELKYYEQQISTLLQYYRETNSETSKKTLTSKLCLYINNFLCSGILDEITLKYLCDTMMTIKQFSNLYPMSHRLYLKYPNKTNFELLLNVIALNGHKNELYNYLNDITQYTNDNNKISDKILEITSNDKKNLIVYIGDQNNEIISKLLTNLSELVNIILITTRKNNLSSNIIKLTENTYREYKPKNLHIDFALIIGQIDCIMEIDLTDINKVFVMFLDSHPRSYNYNLPNHSIALYQNFQHKIEKIITMSYWHQDFMKKFKWIDIKKVQQIYPIYPYEILNKNDDKYFFNKRTDKFIYSLKINENFDWLINILTEVKKTISTIELDVYCDRTQTKYYHHKSWINFHDKITTKQLLKELKKTAIFIYPRKTPETFSIPCLHGMATGNVVFCFDNTSLVELVQDVGVIIKNDEFVVKEIINLIQSPKTLIECQKNAIEYVNNIFNWNYLKKKWLKLLSL